MGNVADRVEIAFDLYPTNVEILSTTYYAVRALVADGDLIVCRLGASGPERLFQRPVTGPLEGSEGVGIAVPTEVGEIWVARAGGCGCGSRLRDVDLFPSRQKVVTGVR